MTVVHFNVPGILFLFDNIKPTSPFDLTSLKNSKFFKTHFFYKFNIFISFYSYCNYL